MKLVLIVLGLLIFIEAVPYFLYPKNTKIIFRYISNLSDDELRLIAFISMGFGIILMYLAKWFL